MKIKLLGALWITQSIIYSQNISGKIYNENENPLEDVKISSVVNKVHTHTNVNGEYVLSIGEKDTLILDKKGYVSQFIPMDVAKTNSFDFILIKESQFLENIVITSKRELTNDIANVDLTTNANRTSQQMLTIVPGLFVAKHAGGGKSDQMFLRGFDLDHGTDININVDNVPVNMVSHAHGQGYTDLHFVIPSLIEKVEFGKGPYDLKRGNFTTAGFVDFKTKDVVEESELSLSYGMFNTKNIRGVFNLLKTDNNHLYVALSTDQTDGYFEASQRFKRNNVLAKYHSTLNKTTTLNLSTTYFSSQWDASGQIPQRAVDNGTISRFGAIDNTEGGNTSRLGAQLELAKYFSNRSNLKTNVYLHAYDFELYSNFTFFNRDSVNGDQIRQKEDRITYGFTTDYTKTYLLKNVELDFLTGLGARFDDIKDNELSYTKNRTQTLQQIQFGDVFETNYFAYAGTDIGYKKIRISLGVRAEELIYDYQDKLDTLYSPKKTSTYALLPKTVLKYQLVKNLSVYGKWGMGFHSNDTRLILSNNDYLDLPLVTSYDVGLDYSPVKNLFLSVAYWNMHSQQEFVYVGDEGVVEPNGASIRQGVDFSTSYQIKKLAFLTLNVNYTKARSVEDNSYIPLAAPLTATATIRVNAGEHLKIGWNARLMGDRPADETNTVKAKGYFINDLNLVWDQKSWSFGLSIENVFNQEWAETQFLTESRLKNETVPVEEIHFTPGEPRFIKGRITYRF